MSQHQTHLQQRVAEVMRLSNDNQTCADCSIPITSSTAWATTTFGAFLCIQCAGVHRKLGVQITRVKSVHMDNWTNEEVLAMKGNRALNVLLEKFVPGDIKSAVSASDTTRDEFIRAKYGAKTFSTDNGLHFRYKTDIPTSKTAVPTSIRSSSSIVEVTKRFVNYFVVVGRGQSLKQTVLSSTGPGDIQFQPVILDSYPDALPDSPLPTHIAQFAFPEGLTLSSTYRDPSFFSFVLTNVSGAKIYACALKFDELLTPFEVISLFVKETMPSWAQSLSSGGSKPTSVYSPKCVLVLSHYPFYTSFRAFLQQIYRISLSESPLPLERYIANFVSEIPVPPQGRVQVQFTLPERTMLLSRPAKNQLPHADFDFRPLFQMLDIPNVLTVFTCLLLEQKVALCSKHLSVLTPIAEALLALLFPLYWQGAYIPVLPSSLLDVIDAPVPFLVGVHSNYLATPTRASDVFFVDLDHNRVIPPSNELGQETVLPKLPERETMKLRAKLQESANIFDPYSAEIAKADLAFENDDYLKPIYDAGAGGMTVPMPSTSANSSAMENERKSSLTLDRKSTLSFQTLKMLVPSQSASLLYDRSISLTNIMGATSNNSQTFNVEDVRQAFLRFFVAVFKRYVVYLNPKATLQPSEQLFDQAGFLRDNSDATSRPFLAIMTASQMFQRFCEDRLVQPPLPEVLFFDASINQKLNRSLTLGKKKYDVSFLEDKTDIIRETFVSPSPSTMGLPDNGTIYKYRGFPRLKRQNFGTIRKPRELYTAREQQRHVAPVDIHQQIYRLSTCVIEPGASWEATRKLVIRLQALYRMHCVRKQYQKTKAALYRIQRFTISHLKRRAMQSKYQEFHQAVVKLQSHIRRRYQEKSYKLTQQALKKLQTFAKGIICKCKYQRFRQGVILLQAQWRCNFQEKWYLKQKKLIVLVQSHARGMLTRIQSRRWRTKYLRELQTKMFTLWSNASVPFVYRSKFWVLYNRIGFLCIGVHLEEIARLQAILKTSEGTKVMPLPTKKDETMMDLVLTRKARKYRQKMLNNAQECRDLAKVHLDEELVYLYEQLKYHTQESNLQSFYRSFGIEIHSKKKKRKLLESLWTNFEQAHLSAEVVLAIGVAPTQYQNVSAMETKLHSRICNDLVYTVNAAMASLQKTKPPSVRQKQGDPKKSKQVHNEQLFRAMAYQNHNLEIQMAEMQRELHKCQQALANQQKQEDSPDSSIKPRKSSLLRLNAPSSYEPLP